MVGVALVVKDTPLSVLIWTPRGRTSFSTMSSRVSPPQVDLVLDSFKVILQDLPIHFLSKAFFNRLLVKGKSAACTRLKGDS